MQPRVLNGVAMVSSGDTVITVWTRPVSPENWSWHMDVLKRVATSHARGVLAFNVILATEAMPTSAMRRAMQDDYTELGPNLRHMVAVAAGGSVWISVVRAMLRTMAQIIGMSARLSVVADVEEGLIAAMPHATGKSPNAADLRRILRDLYVALGLTPPAMRE